jgi:hypothetical protein
MGLLSYITLAVVVIVVAYSLGLWMKAQDKTAHHRPVDAKARFTTTAKPEKPAGSAAKPALPPTDEHQLQVVVDWLLTQAFEQTGVRVADEPLAYQRISEAAQKAMRDLQTQEVASISLPFLTADANGPKHFEARLTRAVIRELARY